jgi:hypothetical protein
MMIRDWGKNELIKEYIQEINVQIGQASSSSGHIYILQDLSEF